MKTNFYTQLKSPPIFWIVVGLLTLLLRMVLGQFPAFTEAVYSRGIFVGIRWVFDWTVTNLPLPLFYVLLFVLIFWLVRAIIGYVKTWKSNSWKKRLLRPLLSIGGFVGLAIFLFFALWGFNYGRLPVEQQLGLQLIVPDSILLHQELELTIAAALQNRNALSDQADIALDARKFPYKTENAVRPTLVKTLQQNGYLTPGRVRGRKIFPKGILLHFSTAGIYLPFVGEGHIDGGLHPIVQPFTMAHELSHGYGFGAEGTCNFWAFLACRQSDDPAIRYSGNMGYLRYLLGALKRLGKPHYDSTKQGLPLAIRTDLEAIKQTHAQYPDWIYTTPLNDAFLKSQGFADGIDSYSRVLALVASLRKAGKL